MDVLVYNNKKNKNNQDESKLDIAIGAKSQRFPKS